MDVYMPDTYVLTLAGTSTADANYRLLQVSDTSTLSMLPVTLQPTVKVHYVVCQLHGVRGDWTSCCCVLCVCYLLGGNALLQFPFLVMFV